MWVTLAKTSKKGGVEPELSISCKEARLLVEGLGHQHNLTTLDLGVF